MSNQPLILRPEQAIVKISPRFAASCRLLILSGLDVRHTELMTVMDRGISMGYLTICCALDQCYFTEFRGLVYLGWCHHNATLGGKNCVGSRRAMAPIFHEYKLREDYLVALVVLQFRLQEVCHVKAMSQFMYSSMYGCILPRGPLSNIDLRLKTSTLSYPVLLSLIVQQSVGYSNHRRTWCAVYISSPLNI